MGILCWIGAANLLIMAAVSLTSHRKGKGTSKVPERARSGGVARYLVRTQVTP